VHKKKIIIAFYYKKHKWKTFEHYVEEKKMQKAGKLFFSLQVFKFYLIFDDNLLHVGK
jgi:hypothetical protein